MNMSTHTVGILAVAGLASGAFAHGEGDIGLLLDGDRIVTAVANDEDATFDEIGERVFAGEIEFVDNLGDGPGFFTTDGPTLPAGFDAFAAGTTISYKTHGAVEAWNGSGFSATANRLRQIQIPGVLEIVSPTDGSIVDGFEYGYGGGEFDEHPDYAMTNDTEAGIYLWRVSFEARDGSGSLIASSDIAWVLFNFGLTEDEHEAALEYAETAIPAPGVALPLMGAGLFAARRRRA